MNKERNILLCVSGTSPAIITETLWCLTQGYNSEKTRYKIDEIHVITTTEGRKTLESYLFKSGKFEEFKKDYPECADIKFSDRYVHILTTESNKKPEASDREDIQLQDVKTGAENEYAANQIYLILRDLIENSSRLHASAAGGRKTMSIYLTVMMQLLARAEDTLSHVVVWDEFEKRENNFFYPTLQQIKEYRRNECPLPISLAFIPFIRLREVGKKVFEHILSDEIFYNRAVEETQKNLRLADADEKLIINLKNLTVSFSDESTTLTGKRMFLLLLYAIYQNDEKFLSDAEITKRLLEQTFRKFSGALGREYSLKTFDDDVNRPIVLEDVFRAVKKIIAKSPYLNPKIPQEKEKAYLKRFKKYMRDSRSDANESLRELPRKIFLKNKGGYGDARFGFDVSVVIEG